MRILRKQLYKELYLCIFVVTLVIIAVFSTNQFIMDLKLAALGKMTVMSVMKLMLLEIPILFAYMLPLSLYISILVVLGRWHLDHEMAVLSACGLSQARLFKMIMGFALGLMLVVTWLMFVSDPIVEGAQNYLSRQALQALSVQKIIPGRFKMLGDGKVIYAKKAAFRNAHLFQVMLAQQTKSTTHGAPHWDVTVARYANQQRLPLANQPFFVFHDGRRFQVTPGSDHLRLSRFKEYGLQLPPMKQHINIWPQNASFMQLWYARDTDLRAMSMLQWRMSMPISAIVLTLIAFPLSRVNPRQGKFAQFLPAIILYFAYANGLYMMRTAIEKGSVSPLLGMWWVHGLALLIAAALWLWRFGIMRLFRLRKSYA